MKAAALAPVPALVLALTLGVAAAVSAAARADAQKPVIRMGVRVDAPPFAWRDEGNDSYLGFLVDLCTDAVTRAGYPFEQSPVTARARREILDGGTRDLDLICDPTTITLARMATFAALDPPGALSFSPIVFVANGAYVTNHAAEPQQTPPGGDAAACVKGDPPAPPENVDAVQTATVVEQEVTPKYFGAGYVVGTTIRSKLLLTVRSGLLQLRAREQVCPVAAESHTEGIAAFCRGELKYYFGDLEIVRSSAARWKAETGEPCAFEIAQRAISYEPYALVISNRHPQFREDFVKALYEVFHHGTATDRFHGHFEGYQMSPFLDTLFRINKIPAGAPPPG